MVRFGPLPRRLQAVARGELHTVSCVELSYDPAQPDDETPSVSPLQGTDDHRVEVSDAVSPSLIAELTASIELLRAEADERRTRADSADHGGPSLPSAEHGSARKLYLDSKERRERFLEIITRGATVLEACSEMSMSYSTYRGWRQKFPDWAARIDVLRQSIEMVDNGVLDDAGPARFAAQYFNMVPTWFQLLFMQELEKLAPGDILLVLWPPEHGKTTWFENYASWKLALDPSYRFLTVSESQGIAKKINGRVMDRMHPMGPSPAYVAKYGPFVPQSGGGSVAMRQPWTDEKFRVYKAASSDERNYSMEAVGITGSIVSARCDRLHIDDPQSTKTLLRTRKFLEWFRQDALSRPAETGTTSICGTRVGEEDFFAGLLDDDNLDGILKVLRFPAIITDHETGEKRPLWEGKHTLESLDRMRRKITDDVFDRNWLQAPGRSRRGKGTFTRQIVERCHDEARSLTQLPGADGVASTPVVFIGLDPALGGKNVVLATEVHPDGKLIPVRIREDVGLQRNEQIMAALEEVVRWCQVRGIVTDVVIEDKNFQKGLKNDERLRTMSRTYGFRIHGHQTGINKYDDEIGIASMASSFIKREVVLPWADDELTRAEIGELKRQLYAWKPFKKGNVLRQDYVMALWFAWILWMTRNKSPNHSSQTSDTQGGFKRDTGGWSLDPNTGLMIPGRRHA